MGSELYRCIGSKVIDVTMRGGDDELVMMSRDMLVSVYCQGFIDGLTDTIGEPQYFSVEEMKAVGDDA